MARYREIAEIFFTADDREYRRVMGRMKRSAKAEGAAIRKSLMAGLGVGVVGGFAAKMFADYEQGLARVQKTTKLSDANLAKLSKTIKEMSRNTIYATDELLAVAQASGQLGITARKDLEEFTRVVAMMGTATNLAGEEAAFALARISSLTGTAYKDVERVASSLVRLGNNMAAREDQIAESAQNIAAAIGHFGATAADVNALGAAVAHVGQDGTKAATAIGKAVGFMNNAVRRGGAELDVFAELAGQSAEQFKATFERNVSDALANVLVGINRAGRGAQDLLDKVGLTDQRTNRVLMAMARNAGHLTKALALSRAAFQENIDIQREYDIATDTLLANSLELINKIKVMAIELGQRLAPALKDVVESWNELLSNRNVVRIVSLAQVVGRAVLAFAALRIAVAGYRLALIGATFAMGAAKAAFLATQAATMALGGAMMALRAGVATLYTLRSAMVAYGVAVKAVTLLLGGLKLAAMLAIGAALMFAPEIYRFFSKAWPQAINYVKGRMAIFGNSIEIMGHRISQFFNASIGGLAELVDKVAEASNRFLGTSFETNLSAAYDNAVLAADRAIAEIEGDNERLERSTEASLNYIKRQFNSSYTEIADKAKRTLAGIMGAETPGGAEGAAFPSDYGPDNYTPLEDRATAGESDEGDGATAGAGAGATAGAQAKPTYQYGPNPYNRREQGSSTFYDDYLTRMREKELAEARARQERFDEAEVKARQRRADALLAIEQEQLASEAYLQMTADERAQAELEYKLETEQQLLAMHQEGAEAQELAFHERMRELKAQQREIELLDDSTHKATLEARNQRHQAELVKQQEAAAKAKLAADRAEMMGAINVLTRKSKTMADIKYKWERAQAISTLLTKGPALIREAYMQGVAAAPPPIGQMLGAANAALAAGAQALGLREVKAAPPPGLRDGGLVPGPFALDDRHAYLMQAGELAIPRKDYADVKRGILAEAGVEMADRDGELPDRGERDMRLYLQGDAGQLFRLANDEVEQLRV